jgi:hypothetical protein
MYQQQRAEARAKSQEMKLKAEQRKKLDENERQLHKKVGKIIAPNENRLLVTHIAVVRRNKLSVT